MKPTKTRFSLLLAIALLAWSIVAPAPPVSGQSSTDGVRIDWEAIDGAIGYAIRITDKDGKEIIATSTETNTVTVPLPPGTYRLRIGVVNKFRKIGSWSEWETIEIKRGTTAIETRFSRNLFNLGIKLSVGIVNYSLSGNWQNYFMDSIGNFNGILAYDVGTHGAFGEWGVLRYTGVEFEGSTMEFKAKQNTAGTTFDIQGSTFGVNLYAATRFDIPVNFILKAGGGVAITSIINKRGTGDVPNESNDPFYKAGIAIEISISRPLFAQFGADYLRVLYQTQNMEATRYYCMIGLRL